LVMVCLMDKTSRDFFSSLYYSLLLFNLVQLLDAT